MDRAQFRDIFAKDVSPANASVMPATQKPISGSVFGASVLQPAWKDIHSWYTVAQEDRAMNPALQRFYAKRMGATTTEIKGSHALFISHSAEIARLIEEAATTASK